MPSTAFERYNESIQSYDQAIKLNASNPVYLYWKGNALYSLERYNESIQSYDQAIKLNASNPDYLYLKGNALYNLKRYNESIQSIDQAIKTERFKSRLLVHERHCPLQPEEI